MKLHLHIIHQEIIDEYALHNLVDEDRWFYLNTVKGIYRLKQAGIIANMELTKHLDKFGYHPVQRVEITLLKRHFAVVTVAVGVLNNPGKSSRFPPTVSRVW